MALKDIKAKIQSTERTHKVTRAMEAVSAVKMRKTQEAAFADRPYARAALMILARLAGAGDFARHPLAEVRTVQRTAVVVITSDKGLAGALNSGVLKTAEALLATVPKDSARLFTVGKKGEDYFRHRNVEIVQALPNKADDVELSLTEALSQKLTEGFLKGDFDTVVAVYSNFKSTFEQVPTSRTLLPLSLETLSELVHDIPPEKGKFSEEQNIESPPAYSVEPSSGEVLEALIPRLVAVSLYHMLLEAKASEHSARMVAMKNASDKSKEVAHDLTRLANKVRQAAITREVSEIVSGREALAT